MLIADDERDYVDANAAACLFLRLPREEVLKLSVDDLTLPEQRSELDALWARFLRDDGVHRHGHSVPRSLQMPDGAHVNVDLSSTPNFRPGRHLAIIFFPAADALNAHLEHAQPPVDAVLTRREREILALVALGNTGVEIGFQLSVSPATVQTHVAHALIKLGAKNRAHGIALALGAGELELVDDAGVP
jgi:DNA-binding CsgD family transcriptional regulator